MSNSNSRPTTASPKPYSPHSKTVLYSALSAQAKAVDTLLMPPPPPPSKQKLKPSKQQPKSPDGKENVGVTKKGSATVQTPVKQKTPKTSKPTAAALGTVNQIPHRSSSPGSSTSATAAASSTGAKKNSWNHSVKELGLGGGVGVGGGGTKRKTFLSPSTPRPLEVKMDVNQLSRGSKPKPFHQKLMESASSTPPPKAIKAGSRYGTPVSNAGITKLALFAVATESESSPPPPPSETAKDVHQDCKNQATERDREIAALKIELELEKAKVLDLECQIQSRNAFIEKIASVARNTAGKIAVNQSMLLTHMAGARNFESECDTLKTKLKETLPFIPDVLKHEILELLGSSTDDIKEQSDEEKLVDNVKALVLQ
ncbi:hypothetical protein BDR26DRAFT_879965 [Obelidium mucronatum]|nr:hypothetical protein BDR26DRAFT_879965 [Obelidium mucronatum]